MDVLVVIGFVVFTMVLFSVFRRRSDKLEDQASRILADVSALGDGLVPTSIHPKVDPNRCIGSGACVQGCPEHDVIGLIGGKVELVNPLACIGHSACAAACPVDAIELVFGTVKRGLELPKLSETFETSQEGVYVIGELGGMGLIRNAIRQGMEVGEYIAESGRRAAGGDQLDVIIVGAGPSGISATLALQKEGLRVLLLEGQDYGGTIAHYPRAKVVMTGPIELPGRKKIRRRTMSKEELLELWDVVRREENLPIHEGQLVKSLARTDSGWRLSTETDSFECANVVLALGRRGSPRKLGVQGEEQMKVIYRLLEPEPFLNKHVLIVGGGNSAAECAIALAEFGKCASVGLSYRRGEFARLRAQVRTQLQELIASQAIASHLLTQVQSIDETQIHLRCDDGSISTLPNDAVVVQIGGTPPSALLAEFGITTVEKRAEA